MSSIVFNPISVYFESMQRRRWWFFILIVSALALVLVISWPQRGPTYQGIPLRAWLRGFEAQSPEARWRSAEAVRQIGTNALPLLISQLHRRPGPGPAWKQTLWLLLSRQSLVKVNLSPPADERGQALAALDALGSAAKCALPAVERLLHEKPPDHRAFLVLARIGPDAIPALTRALTNDEKLIRFGARSCLEMMRSHSEILFPKTPQDAEFMRRTCQFNLVLLQTSLREYKAQHPEQFLPDGLDGRPSPRLPPGFFLPRTSQQTNGRPAALPEPSPGIE